MQKRWMKDAYYFFVATVSLLGSSAVMAADNQPHCAYFPININQYGKQPFQNPPRYYPGEKWQSWYHIYRAIHRKQNHVPGWLSAETARLQRSTHFSGNAPARTASRRWSGKTHCWRRDQLWPVSIQNIAITSDSVSCTAIFWIIKIWAWWKCSKCWIRLSRMRTDDPYACASGRNSAQLASRHEQLEGHL